MSGDCGHGWGYHSGGPGSPCDLCTEEEKRKQLLLSCAKALVNDVVHAAVHEYCVSLQPENPDRRGHVKQVAFIARKALEDFLKENLK